MRFSIITLFPDLIDQYTSASILGRAKASGIVTVETINPRDFTTDPHRKVDDTPYGGGGGMVMMCKPLLEAFNSLLPLAPSHRVFLTSPMGERFSQPLAESLTECEQIVVICGHYEGIDARILDLIPNLELISLGDFVLTGGELMALTMVDAVTRLLPGALGNEACALEESFTTGLLEYPHYTRPAEFEGLAVPEVLLSGNHAAIARWRREQAKANTLRYRPDLIFSENNGESC